MLLKALPSVLDGRMHLFPPNSLDTDDEFHPMDDRLQGVRVIHRSVALRRFDLLIFSERSFHRWALISYVSAVTALPTSEEDVCFDATE
jgi:hypothetical protein